MEKDGNQGIELSSLQNTDGFRDTASAQIFNPDHYESIRLRRIFAYAIDVICIAILTVIATVVATLLGIISFGVLTPLLILCLALIPLAYNTLFIGGSWQATPGMRFMNVRMEMMNGGAPDYITAFLQVALFYFSIAVTSSLILVVALFNPRGRCLHDYLVGTVIRRIPLIS
ncbi:RDD family protein [Sneathiella sp.]|uniref:RDD family protein n=1 Tax=Sneathiella sp. TaxID=1964365 RepID=UPI00356A66E4